MLTNGLHLPRILWYSCPPLIPFLPSFSPSSLLRRPLVYLLVRKPLTRPQILLLERRVEHAQAADFPRGGRVVPLYVGFRLAVGGLEGEGTCGLRFISLHISVYAYI